MHSIPDIQVHPMTPVAEKAIRFANAGDHTSSLEQWNLYLVDHPAVAEAYVLRGLVKASLGDGQGLLEDYKSASEAKPEDGRFRAMYHFALGGSMYCVYLEDGITDLLDQAIENMDIAVEAAPDDLTALSYRGTALCHAEKPEAANEDFTRVIALHPENAHARFMRGAISMGNGALADAKEDFEIALENREQLEEATSNALEQRYEEIMALLLQA